MKKLLLTILALVCTACQDQYIRGCGQSCSFGMDHYSPTDGCVCRKVETCVK